MRISWLLFAVVALGCGNTNGAPTCLDNACPPNAACVFAPGATTPACLVVCEDDAPCSTGQACQCAGSCAGCENCIRVCR